MSSRPEAAAYDIAIEPSEVTFEEGSGKDTKKTVEVSFLSDCLFEGREAFNLLLSNSEREVDRLKFKILDGENRAGVWAGGELALGYQ